MKLTIEAGNGMVAFKFDGKPDDDVRAMLKHAGFRWNPAGGVWWRRKVAGYADVAQAIRDHWNPPALVLRPCWDCKAPNGTMRRYGPATPVLCPVCAARYQAQRDDQIVAPLATFGTPEETEAYMAVRNDLIAKRAEREQREMMRGIMEAQGIE